MCIGYTDEPDGESNHIFMKDFFDNYIVVKTSMTVKLTLKIASKKKDCDQFHQHTINFILITVMVKKSQHF